MNPHLHQDVEVMAVVLAGGQLMLSDSEGVPKALVPIANRPVISYPLKLLQIAGIHRAFIVAEGDSVATAIREWIDAEPFTSLRCEIVCIDEGSGSVEALRKIIGHVHTDDFVLISGDIVCDISLKSQILQHRMQKASATILIGEQQAQHVDNKTFPKTCVGISNSQRLEYYQFLPRSPRDLKIRTSMMQCCPFLEITTALTSMQTIIFNTGIIRAVLENRSDMHDIDRHLLPFLVKWQRSMPTDIRISLVSHSKKNSTSSLASDLSSKLTLASTASATPCRVAETSFLTRCNNGDVSCIKRSLDRNTSAKTTYISNAVSKYQETICSAYFVQRGSFCRRANSLQGFLEINLRILSPDSCFTFMKGLSGRKGDNLIASDVVIGPKSSFGHGCICDSGTSLGERSSVKRSVVGKKCTIGNFVRIINSVVMDGVSISERCTINNSIVFSGCVVGSGAQLKDCKVGPDSIIPANVDQKGEIILRR